LAKPLASLSTFGNRAKSNGRNSHPSRASGLIHKE
jgi:hypothetical protein